MNSNQSHHGQPGGAPYDRDREMDDRHRAIQQHEEMARRDQERERERERDRENNSQFQSAHQSSAGSIPIHQPVASRTSGAIHSPGGLLANYNGSTSSVPIGGSFVMFDQIGRRDMSVTLTRVVVVLGSTTMGSSR
ncbi:hypothetical protein NQ176_g6630 [Zarea fungicola]|uniref:Uncharacterized protein n=1 Tax=Zarea fungicola TaxID=93591 RepID=A0ACC1N3B6_9HYPO|nr:hypothetical protein NQ176_g6630 [Lecanicillium fungicola]